jgi:hypothetical protein
MTLQEVHGVLREALDRLARLHGELDSVSTDTAFAIGEALGMISRAKALVGRDIDDARQRGFGAPTSP